MKKLPILLLALCALLAACGTSKITCKDPSSILIIFSATGTEYLGVTDSSSTDSLAIVTRYAKGTGMTQALGTDTLTVGPYISTKAVVLYDIQFDILNSDYRITFPGKSTQYDVTAITSHNRTERRPNHDIGHSSYGVCYKDVSLKVNGASHLIKSAAGTYAVMVKF